MTAYELYARDESGDSMSGYFLIVIEILVDHGLIIRMQLACRYLTKAQH